MQYYLIQPKDPLIIRSGRPFEEISDAAAARFPPPSTVAGALRNIHARSTGKPLNSELLKIAVTGPLAIRIPVNGEALTQAHILLPKPADAAYFCQQNELGESLQYLVRYKPMPLAKGEGCDLPNGLQPLFAENAPTGKPINGPNWWSLHDLLAWRRGEEVSYQRVLQNGWTPAEPDIRTHIAINNQSRSAEVGKIFQTTGLTMWQKCEENQVFPTTSIGILAGIAGEITEPLLNLGGERRLASIVPCSLWPSMPNDLVKHIQQAGGFTLTFLTPVLFSQGWRPNWLNEDTLEGTPPCCQQLTVRLRAAALERWLPQSGWDLANNKPRAAQKMIPAGATFWFDILGESTNEDLNALWMAALCDEAQHNQNGFGLALPAPYRCS